MELYNITDENERKKLIFSELNNLQSEVERKSGKTSLKSKILWWIYTLLELTILISSACIVTISSINSCQNVPTIVLGGIIFAISGINQLFKLGQKGYNYRQASFRLKRIMQQTRNMLYTFSNYTTDQVLAYVSLMRTEIDEIDLDLYKFSIPGEAKFGNSLRIVEPEEIMEKRSSNRHDRSDSNSHIHIHIDNEPNELLNHIRSKSEPTTPAMRPFEPKIKITKTNSVPVLKPTEIEIESMV